MMEGDDPGWPGRLAHTEAEVQVIVPPWDAEGFVVSGDNEWTAGCRWLQSWWREHALHLPAGELSQSNPKLVGSMLPVGSDSRLNFLSADIARAVEHRLSEKNGSGIIAKDRLYRNLLSSQPACFNLFGPFVTRPDSLLQWVQAIDHEATQVAEIRFEWAPSREEHFNGGSAFDAFVVYRANRLTRFLGIETKYAENLSKSSINVRPVYFDITTPDHGWRPGATVRLDVPRYRQFWLNTLLVQSLGEKDDNFERGTSVVVSCVNDDEAQLAGRMVQGMLLDESQIRVSSYEEVLQMVYDPDLDDWKRQFRSRYLDFGPVKSRIANLDFRQG